MASESRPGRRSKPTDDRNKGVKSSVAIAILLSKRQPRNHKREAPKWAARPRSWARHRCRQEEIQKILALSTDGLPKSPAEAGASVGSPLPFVHTWLGHSK